MSYEEQREWERNDRRQREEIESREYELDRQREDAAAEQRRAGARIRSLASEAEEFADEAGRLSQELRHVHADLAVALRFIESQGLTAAFLEWKTKGENLDDDDC